ncbi:MAG: MmcQ/YjbR family DNA-binding protein [Oscillospiraceae bacterium]|nr:MmcQ/YjbR family DNA-binding protein [Ruminococcus sp.]MBQ7003457.1 MmcQ/YjbR family DNA-binding protein [Oscillospiraceae bacterium]MBQ7013548.1 MmcQ/YjbR family DNA-binding protein [Oscillospiraceae bacterium]
MTTKQDAIRHCLGYPDAYEDYPFHDPNWCVIRHRSNHRVFAWIFDKDGFVWINVKCDPAWTQFWRDAFPAVRPAYHLNKTHWNSIILDGSIPTEDIHTMIRESHQLTAPKRKGAPHAR